MRIVASRFDSFYRRVSWALVMSSLLILAIPAAWAQEKEWEKHMKEGGKAYAKGMSKKYYWGGFTSQTNLAGAPEFAKAEREFLDALALAQSFPAGDVRTADTLGRLADTYSEERKFDEAEERGKQAIALLEVGARPAFRSCHWFRSATRCNRVRPSGISDPEQSRLRLCLDWNGADL